MIKNFIIGVLAIATIASTASLIAERSQAPSPDANVLSMRLVHEDQAWDIWHDLHRSGESVCLTELNDGKPRYWLHSCPVSRFMGQ